MRKSALISGGKFSGGGAGTHLKNLLSLLNGEGWALALIGTGWSWSAAVREELQARGVDIRVPGSTGRLRRVWDLAKCWYGLLNRRFDVVYWNGSGRSHLMAKRFVREGAFHVYHEHVWLPGRDSLNARCMLTSDGTVATSRMLEQEIRATLPEIRCRTVPCLMDLEVSGPVQRRTGRGGGVLRIAYLGRLSPQKRIHRLVAEWDRIAQTAPIAPATLDVYGADEDGWAMLLLNEALGERPMPSGVRFRGAYTCAELPALFKDIDLVVLPSEMEGLPLTLIEAMSQGVPVVATAVGGTATLGEDNPNVEITGVDWDSFLEGMRRIALRVREGKIDHGVLCRWAQERFDPRRVGEQWLRVFDDPRGFFAQG